MDRRDGVETDRQTGAALDSETVGQLRRGLVWMQKNRGLRLKDVAVGCDVPEHTVRNFAYGKATRPDNTFLGRLFRYLGEFRSAIPSELAWKLEVPVGASARHRHVVPLHYEIVRAEMQLDEEDLLRVYERYTGYYLCFFRSQPGSRISVSWLHIRALNPAVQAKRGELLMPRFTLYTRAPDRIDMSQHHELIAAGYVTTRHGNIFLTGQQDGELRYAILREPATRKFAYLEGLCLFTAVDDRAPFASRIVCQYLGAGAARATWQDRIAQYSDEAFRRQFSNADVIERVLGSRELGLGGEHG